MDGVSRSSIVSLQMNSASLSLPSPQPHFVSSLCSKPNLRTALCCCSHAILRLVSCDRLMATCGQHQDTTIQHLLLYQTCRTNSHWVILVAMWLSPTSSTCSGSCNWTLPNKSYLHETNHSAMEIDPPSHMVPKKALHGGAKEYMPRHIGVASSWRNNLSIPQHDLHWTLSSVDLLYIVRLPFILYLWPHVIEKSLCVLSGRNEILYGIWSPDTASKTADTPRAGIGTWAVPRTISILLIALINLEKAAESKVQVSWNNFPSKMSCLSLSGSTWGLDWVSTLCNSNRVKTNPKTPEKNCMALRGLSLI